MTGDALSWPGDAVAKLIYYIDSSVLSVHIVSMNWP